jgi:hypothetical protein
MPRIPKIDNWSITNNRLVGNVYNHPNFDDGEHIITSPITHIDTAIGIARTKSMDYFLGTPVLAAKYTPGRLPPKGAS